MRATSFFWPCCPRDETDRDHSSVRGKKRKENYATCLKWDHEFESGAASCCYYGLSKMPPIKPWTQILQGCWEAGLNPALLEKKKIPPKHYGKKIKPCLLWWGQRHAGGSLHSQATRGHQWSRQTCWPQERDRLREWVSVYMSVRVIKASLRFLPEASQQVLSADVWNGRSSSGSRSRTQILIYGSFPGSAAGGWSWWNATNPNPYRLCWGFLFGMKIPSLCLQS